MKLTTIAILLSAAGISAAPIPRAVSPVSTPIVGDYVEARTASVFAGACHYNGELTTTGRDAVMAWDITAGTWKGVDLTHVRAAAAVSSEDNLGQTSPRKSELVIDSAASDAQAAAMTDLLETRCASALGSIALVRRVPVSFHRDFEHYEFAATGFASATVDAMPDHECCKQPNLVWYTPLVTVQDRRVGFTRSAGYSSGKIADTWQREQENSAFYGTFTTK
jgi:hypothetical protein